MVEHHDRDGASPVNPNPPCSEQSSQTFLAGLQAAIARGVLPTNGFLWTVERLIEIAECSETSANDDLRQHGVPYRHFFARRWIDIADLLGAVPLIDPRVTKPRRGGFRGKPKGGPNAEA